MSNTFSIIEWQTLESLGTYNASSSLNFQFLAVPQEEYDKLASIIKYKLLSGSLPKGTKRNPIQITSDGLLTGVLDQVTEQTTYTFTVRAQDQYGNIRDRTFNIVVTVGYIPSITTPSGSLLYIEDSVYVSYQIQYDNPISTNRLEFTVSNGELPPGLQLMMDGKIIGYPIPPVLIDGSIITKTYNFSVQMSSSLGNDVKEYSITVQNQDLIKPPNNRIPVLLNSQPLHLPINLSDPYFDYYLDRDKVIPTVRANEYFTFKFIGHDFEGQTLLYNFGILPPGLTGDINTGWITGSPIMNAMGINTYQISVSVCKSDNTSIVSATETYFLTITNEVVEDITWVTPVDMGYIYNGTISEIKIQATSSKHLVYSFQTGNIPPNLELKESGDLVGRVSFQPSSTVLQTNDETEFYFTVLVYSDEFPVLKSTREFKLTVKQYFSEPLESIYFKATPNLLGRQVINSLLTDNSLIPTDYLYRPDDIYFGKAIDVKVLHVTGMPVTNLNVYIDAIQKNHYYRNVILGNLKTAVARDENNNIIYEVVYCDIIDDLVNSKGKTLPLDVKWPHPISARLGPWLVNNGEIPISYTNYYASLSPGVIPDVYPASIPNMRTELLNNIEQTVDNILLPKWMTSQQLNGNTLGFIEAWVICYTLPGYSETIKTNINNNWEHSFNEIDFEIDRFIVDKSATYNYNTLLQQPVWNELPSGSPQPNPINEYDMAVIFPRKTILVDNISQ